MNVVVFLRSIEEKGKKKVLLPIFFNYFTIFSSIMTILDALYIAGRPFSPLYSILMRTRALLYHRNVLKTTSLPVPVISVGNLTMGGTGKTPTVRMLARLLQQRGYHPAVVSRGYGGTATEPVNVVSTDQEILLSPGEAGDEPYLLASTVPGLPVITGRKRALPCRYACDTLHCDTIILDDGFQHLAVKRDLNLVLFNATTLAGNSRVFPGGELREPVCALRRADAFLLTGLTPSNRKRAEAFAALLESRFSHAPVFTSENTVLGLFSQTGEQLSAETLHRPLFAFSGIAHPERFLSLLAAYNIDLVGSSQFADHVKYCRKDVEEVIARAKQRGAAALVTTRKDMVKISGLKIEFPIYCLEIEAAPSPRFIDFLEDKFFNLPMNRI